LGLVTITWFDVLRATHLMLLEYGVDAEDEAARHAELMRGQGEWNRSGTSGHPLTIYLFVNPENQL